MGAMNAEYPVEYVLARHVLLDALDARAPHLDAVVGAQAVYLHTGDGDHTIAPDDDRRRHRPIDSAIDRCSKTPYDTEDSSRVSIPGCGVAPVGSRATSWFPRPSAARVVVAAPDCRCMEVASPGVPPGSSRRLSTTPCTTSVPSTTLIREAASCALLGQPRC